MSRTSRQIIEQDHRFLWGVRLRDDRHAYNRVTVCGITLIIIFALLILTACGLLAYGCLDPITLILTLLSISLAVVCSVQTLHLSILAEHYRQQYQVDQMLSKHAAKF